MDNIQLENQQQTKMPEPKQDKESKPRRQRRTPPVLMPLGQVKEITRSYKVSQSSTDWQNLKQDDMFSTDPEGTVFYLKKSVSSAVDLDRSKSIRVSGAAVYRVFR